MAQDPFRYFRIEARELVEQLSQATLANETHTLAADHIAAMLRHAHTLKGAARVVKQPQIADHAHAIEDLLEPLRKHPAPLGSERTDAVLALLDAITRLVEGLAAAPPVPTRKAETKDDIAMHADAAALNTLLEGMSEATAHVAALNALVTQMQARREISAHTATRLTDAVRRIDVEVSEAHEQAERLRLAPAHAVFAALQRTARDVARAQNKRVHFTATGGDVRLEAHVLSALQTALVQCVRNAVVHGIDQDGTVAVAVMKVGRDVVFRCDDDGRGLNFAAIRKALAAKGVAETQGLNEAALIDHLLRGGVSTARELSGDAGRGVGLDLVRETATRFGGTIRIGQAPGGGTRVDVVVPLSLAASDALIVESGGITASIALDAIERSMHIAPDAILRDGPTVRIICERRTVRWVPLGAVLDPRQTGHAVRTALIVKSVHGELALGVDRVIGKESVLHRKLPALAPAHAYVLGASLDARGKPRIALDPDALVAAALAVQTPEAAEKPARLPILVVDDSLTSRMLEQSILESAGYEVDLATSGEEGLEKARLRRYGLFLVDVEMPGIDGFTFVERTRQTDDGQPVPAILVSSRCAPADFERGKRAGADAYMVKSEFDQNALLARIRGFLG